MSTLPTSTTHTWWQQLRPRLTLIYILAALILIGLGVVGQIRLLNEVGKTFGGFFWAIDNTDGQIVVVSSLMEPLPVPIAGDSLTMSNRIIAVNNVPGPTALTQVYSHTRPGTSITYTVQHNHSTTLTLRAPAEQFTFSMWLETYGLAFLAGLCWLIVGALLLATARDWSGAVEGLTFLPPSMLFLLYSHWGNVQQPSSADAVFQLLWVPSFALLGAAFIHLSLAYRPEGLTATRVPRLTVDGLPYLALLALLAYEWSSYFIFGQVPTRVNLTVSLGYAILGGLISFFIGASLLIRMWRTARQHSTDNTRAIQIPSHLHRHISDLLRLWIGGAGLGFCLDVLPMLFTGQTLLPFSVFYLLTAIYPLLLACGILSLRLVGRLHISLMQREEILREQQKTAEELRLANEELTKATSLLLHADAHLRSLLSQRIHDQPKQQALRIRSLLGHWQHKLRVEAERDASGKVTVQPVIEALGKVRKISEELESDLRGLQLLVEDAYQRRSLGLKLHLEKLIREDLPMLHAESPLQVQADLWALDALCPDLEQTPEGAKIAEAISYAVTQALLNIYNHAGATYATVRTIHAGNALEVFITDDGRGFDAQNIPPEKTSLFKARLKVREAGGTLGITSIQRPQPNHGTRIIIDIPLPENESIQPATPRMETRAQRK